MQDHLTKLQEIIDDGRDITDDEREFCYRMMKIPFDKIRHNDRMMINRTHTFKVLIYRKPKENTMMRSHPNVEERQS